MPELDTPPALTGTDALMADVMGGITDAPPTETPPVATPPTDTKAIPPKPAAPPTPPKAEPKTPDAKATPPAPKPPKADANAELRKQYETTKAELDTYKTKSVPEMEKKLKELEAKVPTEDTLKKIEAAEKRIAELQGRLTQVDYAQSDEFKNTYVKPWEQTLANTLETVKQLPIRTTNADGQVQSRVATPDDFWTVANAPLSRRGEVASELFGNNAVTVIAAINQLQDFRSRADQAIANHAAQNEVRQKEQAQVSQRERQSYEQTHKMATQELQEKYPDYFGPDANDPEATKALEQGFSKIDEWMAQPGQTPEERAQKAAVVRAWAASFPKNVHTITKQAAKITALEAELAKFRSSDPGAGAEDGKPTGGDKDKGLTGTAALLPDFDK